jgi:hypothetical protein
MINPPKLESIMLPTKEDLFNIVYKTFGSQCVIEHFSPYQKYL